MQSKNNNFSDQNAHENKGVNKHFRHDAMSNPDVTFYRRFTFDNVLAVLIFLQISHILKFLEMPVSYTRTTKMHSFHDIAWAYRLTFLNGVEVHV